MSERYKNLYKFKSNLYIPSSPVVVNAGALLQDNATGNVLLQLKFENIQNKVIVAIFIRIKCYNAVKERIAGIDFFQYLDLYVLRNQRCCEKMPIVLPDATTRFVEFELIKVVFEDGTLWSNSDNEFKSLRLNENLNDIMNKELILQLNREGEKIGLTQFKASLVPLQFEDLWICTCDQINSIEEDRCFNCQVPKDWIFKNANVDVLQPLFDEYLDEYKKKQAKIAEQRKTIIKKIGKISGTIAIILAIIFALAIALFNFVILPRINSIKVLKMIENGNYIGAIRLYYEEKDAVEKINQLYELYDKAEKMIENQNYSEAIEIYYILGDFKKSREKVNPLMNYFTSIFSAGDGHTVGIGSDGTVVATGDNAAGQCDVSGWTDIIAVSAGGAHTVGLKSDGTVVATGDNAAGQCDVSGWTDIIAASAGGAHTVGLKSDGKVVATGDNEYKQCSDVSGWFGTIAVSAGGDHTVGLKYDGTVVAAGNNDYGQCNVLGWSDIIAISVGNGYTVGLKSDGTARVTGNEYSYNEARKLYDWKLINVKSVDNQKQKY